MIYIQSWKVSLITCLVHSSYVYQLHRTVIFPLGTRPGESAEPTKNKGQSTIWIAAGGGGLVFPDGDNIGGICCLPSEAVRL